MTPAAKVVEKFYNRRWKGSQKSFACMVRAKIDEVFAPATLDELRDNHHIALWIGADDKVRVVHQNHRLPRLILPGSAVCIYCGLFEIDCPGELIPDGEHFVHPQCRDELTHVRERGWKR